MERTEQEKWSERYFQVCLALISRTSITHYGTSTALNVGDIMSKADRIIHALQDKEKELFAKYEND